MEVSSEISQKIRSAIKAKLQELGAYVDDELPDYIMVMVANKRSRSQMKNDLGLFLADNTDAFTEWLHCLLVKLQTIRSDSDKSTDKLNALREKKKDGKLHKVVQAGKKGGKLVNKKKIDKRSSDLMTSDLMTSDHSDGIIAKRKVTSIDRQVDTEETQLQGRYNGGECMEHDIKDSFDGNSFMHNKQIDAKNVQDSIDLRQFSVTEASGDTLTDDQETEVVDSRAVGVLKIVDISDGTINQSTSVKGLISEQHVQSSAVRKRRASTSALDHVSKVGSYDPFNPAVRTMASFVSETALKSTSLQTNRQTDTNASEGTIRDGQTEFQEECRQPPQKLFKSSETVCLEDIKQALAEVLEKKLQMDEAANFSRMVESSLRKLHQHDFSLAKLRIQQVLFEFEALAPQGDVLESKQNKNTLKQISYSNENSKCNSVNTYIDSPATTSGLESSNSLNVSLSGNRLTTFTSPHTPPGSPPAYDQNSYYQANCSSTSDQHIDNVESRRQKISSSITDKTLTVKSDCLNSEPVNSESSEFHTERVIFHPKSKMESSKSSVAYERMLSRSKIQDCAGKSRERESGLGKSQQGDQHLQSPASLGKADMESSSSVHSSPISLTSGLTIRRHVTSASRESTLSPHDIQPKPGASHIHKSKPSSGKSKLSPSILVDSIHNRRRPESSESASVLRQNFQRDKSPRAVDPSKNDTQDSPRHYGSEALKVMAKNLKITVINKRAVKSPQESSSDDSDDDDDFDSSDEDDEDEEKNNDTEKTKNEAALDKNSFDQSTS